MPGLVPGIHVLGSLCGEKTWITGTSPVMTSGWILSFVSDRYVHSPYHTGTHGNFFIIFVDAIFTTLLKPSFTSTFDVIDAKRPRDCLCRARHAD
jgi:hypothetical protein